MINSTSFLLLVTIILTFCFSTEGFFNGIRDSFSRFGGFISDYKVQKQHNLKFASEEVNCEDPDIYCCDLEKSETNCSLKELVSIIIAKKTLAKRDIYDPIGLLKEVVVIRTTSQGTCQNGKPYAY